MNTIMRDKIKHVVVLMLENRGFDHALGWLYHPETDPPLHHHPDGRHTDIPPHQRTLRPFEGLAGLTPEQMRRLENRHRLGDREVVLPPHRGARSPATPNDNPHEDFVHIMAQMWDLPPEPMASKATREAATGWPRETPPMRGYLRDFATLWQWTTPAERDLAKVMETYTPEQLPVLSGLARHYAVSDLWFCSVPTQTNANRAFYLAGTSRGLVTNSFYDPFGMAADALPIDTRTLFHALDEKGTSWAYFWHNIWPPAIGKQYARRMFPAFAGGGHDKNFPKMESFYELARKGQLPAVSIIEPEWGGEAAGVFMQGNDMHPPADTTPAEDLLERVYDALSRGPAWNETLLVVTFDENGGTYDHMPPPAATPTGLDRAGPGHTGAGYDETTGTQFGFGFDQFGIRVPALLISPRIAPSTLFRSADPDPKKPFDHTSIIATILDWQGVPRADWKLGNRVAVAPTFDQVLTLDEPRTDVRFGKRPTVRPGLDPVKYGDAIYLKYLGDRSSAPKYVLQAYKGTQYFPRIGAPEQLPRVVLRLEGGPIGAPIKNGALIRIVSTEPELGQYTTLGAFTNEYLYYYTGGYEQQSWQIRIASYRDESAEIYPGDDVYFVNRHYADARMIQSPKDALYLTTRAGKAAEWGAFTLEPAR